MKNIVYRVTTINELHAIAGFEKPKHPLVSVIDYSKVNVVNAIISELWLKNATAIQVRAEDFHDKFHYVIGRAVTDLGKFMRWVTKNIDQKEIKDPLNGVIYLKGGDLSDEVKPYQDSRIYNISDFFEEEFFVTKKLIYIPMSH